MRRISSIAPRPVSNAAGVDTESARDACAAGPRNDRDAVVALLAVQHAVIAGGLQLKQWELVVRTLCFLNTEDIRLFFLEPTSDQRQARDYRIDVPSGDLHFSF